MYSTSTPYPFLQITARHETMLNYLAEKFNQLNNKTVVIKLYLNLSNFLRLHQLHIYKCWFFGSEWIWGGGGSSFSSSSSHPKMEFFSLRFSSSHPKMAFFSLRFSSSQPKMAFFSLWRRPGDSLGESSLSSFSSSFFLSSSLDWVESRLFLIPPQTDLSTPFTVPAVRKQISPGQQHAVMAHIWAELGTCDNCCQSN